MTVDADKAMADEGMGKSMPGEDAGMSELDEELAEDVLQPNLLSLAHRLEILSLGQVPTNHKLLEQLLGAIRVELHPPTTQSQGPSTATSSTISNHPVLPPQPG